MAVEESRRLLSLPRRPAWRDSDPRWRRRILTGVWVLVLIPVVTLLRYYQWFEQIPVPTFIKAQGRMSLEDTCFPWLFSYFAFCIGVVLLFSRKRGRRETRLDWTRRWGVILSYTVLVLGIPEFALVSALVAIGIGALCLSMPLHLQPAATGLFVNLGAWYIWYGPYPGDYAGPMLAVCSSIVILLGCVPLYNALRSSGPRAAALGVLAPLAIAAGIQISLGCERMLFPKVPAWGLFFINTDVIYRYLFYFDPGILVLSLGYFGRSPHRTEIVGEVIKWLDIFAIAVWLSVAQFMSRWSREPAR